MRLADRACCFNSFYYRTCFSQHTAYVTEISLDDSPWLPLHVKAIKMHTNAIHRNVNWKLNHKLCNIIAHIYNKDYSYIHAYTLCTYYIKKQTNGRIHRYINWISALINPRISSYKYTHMHLYVYVVVGTTNLRIIAHIGYQIMTAIGIKLMWKIRLLLDTLSNLIR